MNTVILFLLIFLPIAKTLLRHMGSDSSPLKSLFGLAAFISPQILSVKPKTPLAVGLPLYGLVRHSAIPSGQAAGATLTLTPDQELLRK